MSAETYSLISLYNLSNALQLMNKDCLHCFHLKLLFFSQLALYSQGFLQVPSLLLEGDSKGEMGGDYNFDISAETKDGFFVVKHFKKDQVSFEDIKELKKTEGVSDGAKLAKFIIAAMVMHSGIVTFFP